jgi:hypothetical protein
MVSDPDSVDVIVAVAVMVAVMVAVADAVMGMAWQGPGRGSAVGDWSYNPTMWNVGKQALTLTMLSDCHH